MVAFRAASFGTAVTSGTTVTGVIPTGTVQGDLLIAAVLVKDGSSNTTVVNDETGWTEVAVQQSTANPRVIQRVFSKVAGPSEGNPTFDLSSSIGNAAEAVVAMVALSAAGSVLAAAYAADGADPYAMPGLTVAAQSMYLLSFGHFGRGATSATSTPSGYTTHATHNGNELWAIIHGKSETAANPPGASWSMNNGGTMHIHHMAIGDAVSGGGARSYGMIIG